jgi:hypothetical protein
MAHRLTLLAVSVVATLTLFSVGCDKNPLDPPDPRQVISLELAAPESLPPGGTEQLRVTAVQFDGIRSDVTAEASWTSADASIIMVAPDGRASGGLLGETDVRAAFSGMTAVRRVMVLPPGTFKLSGRVLDANVGVPDARVEVTAGSATGLWTLTRNGNYALYGVAGTTEVTVTKQGYHPLLERLDVSRHLTANLPLALIAPPWDPSGTYTMTVTAAPECRDALPEDARARTYPASIAVASNARFAAIRFPGTQFVSLNWWFWDAARIGDSLTLEASDYFNYGPPLVERLSPARYFLVEGTDELAKAEVFRSPTGLEGQLDATISIREGNNNWFEATRVATCRSVNHRLTFTR